MNPFADVIERKQIEADSRSAKLAHEKEVQSFIRETVRSYKNDLLEIFDERIVKFFDFSYVRIKDYEINVIRDYGHDRGTFITVGHYSSDYNKVKIPFQYSMNKSQLTGIVKEAMRALVKKAYQTK